MIDLYHIESEQSVIGGLLIDPQALDRIDWLRESDFYVEAHRIAYRAIAMLSVSRKPIDAITVAESLASIGVPDDVVGLAYLGQLAANVPSAASIVRYAEIVSEKRKLRDLLAASADIAELAQGHSQLSASERIDAASWIVFKLAEGVERDGAEPVLVGSILADVVSDIEARFESGGAIVGMSTGLTDLDTKTCGLMGGDLVIIAGRPSMGKTALALNVAENAAVHDGKSVLVFSMEMGKKQLVERSIASLGSVEMGRLRNGQLVGDDFDRIGVAMQKLHASKLVVDDRAALTVAQMRSRARRVARKHGLDLIVVDYIQLAQGDTQSKNGNREQEVSSISRGLKAIAKEFNVPVIALSQLSRKVEERADKRPLLSDLRESGAIEQDADLILMMYREDYYRPESELKGIAEIIIGKQRMGETGAVQVAFQGKYSRFKDLSGEHWQQINAARSTASQPSQPFARKRGFQ